MDLFHSAAQFLNELKKQWFAQLFFPPVCNFVTPMVAFLQPFGDAHHERASTDIRINNSILLSRCL